MNRLVHLILVSVFCFCWAEVKVEKVFEAKSIREFNQWIMRNKTKYPTLEYIKVSCEIIKWGKEYKVIYYNKDGSEYKNEILKAKTNIWLDIETYPFEGRVIMCESPKAEGGEGGNIAVTAKNFQGGVTYSFISSGNGLFSIPTIGFFKNNINDKKVEIMNWNGEKIGEFLGNAEYHRFGRMEYVSTQDTKYTFFSFMKGAPYVSFWEEKEGTYHELWTKRLKSYIILSISDDGQYGCIGDSGSMLVYNRIGDLVYKYCFPGQDQTNPFSVFSHDNNYLVCASSSQMALIDNKTGKPLWEITVPGDEFVRQVFFVRSSKYIILTHISRAEAYLFDLKGKLLATIKGPTLDCSVIGDFLILDHREENFHKTIYSVSEE